MGYRPAMAAASSSATAATPSAPEWISGGHYFARRDGRRIFYHRAGAGTAIVLLHGFPTWSYDYAELAAPLAVDHDVIAPDFLGYGASDKPRGVRFTVADSADTIEALVASLGVRRARLVVHDYGAIVGQELLDRRRRRPLAFELASVHVMNSGVVFESYRPTRTQRVLAVPLVGAMLARAVTQRMMTRGLDAVRGRAHPLSARDAAELWHGIALGAGYQLLHRHIRYNHERVLHGARWLDALAAYDGPLQLVWGLADPVSGAHVLDALRPRVPRARVDALDGVGHYPMSEAPELVERALRAAF